MYRSSIWLPPRKQRKVVGEQHWKEDLQYTHLDFKNSELCKYYRLFKAKVPLCYADFHLLPQPHLPSQSLHGRALPLGAELYSHWCCWFCPSPSGLRVRQHGPCSPPPEDSLALPEHEHNWAPCVPTVHISVLSRPVKSSICGNLVSSLQWSISLLDYSQA